MASQNNGIETPKRRTKNPYARRRIPKPDGGYTISVPPGYYTAEEAQKKLRMGRRTFFHNVKRGNIPHEEIPMMKHHMYPKKEIDTLADANIVFMLAHQMLEEETSRFRIATAEDIPGIINVFLKLWPDVPTTPEKIRASWYAKNPQLDYVVTQHDLVMGFLGAVPYTPEALEDQMSGKRDPRYKSAEYIRTYEPGQEYDLFVGIIVRSDVGQDEKRQHQKQYAARLLLGFFHELANLIKRGVIIRRLYACSDQPDGMQLCKDIGFELQPRVVGDHYNRYVLDLRTADSLLARRLREEVATSGETETPRPAVVYEPRTVRIAGEQLVEVMRLLQDGSDLLTQSEQAIERLGVGAYPLRRAIQAWQAQVLPYIAPTARGVEEESESQQ